MRVLTIAGGILMIATGAFCFINPGQTFMTMAFLIGAVMVINGLIHAVGFVLSRGNFGIGDNNGWILIDAILTLLLGIMILCMAFTGCSGKDKSPEDHWEAIPGMEKQVSRKCFGDNQ